MSATTELLERCRAALDAADANAVADCYAERFLHLTRRGDSWAHEWRRNNAAFRALLERAADFYARLGAARFELGSVTETELHHSHTLVRATYRVLSTDQSELVSFDVTHMVRVRGGVGSIVGVVAHSERKRLERRGLSSEDAALYFDLPTEDSLLQSGVRRARDSERTG